MTTSLYQQGGQDTIPFYLPSAVPFTLPFTDEQAIKTNGTKIVQNNDINLLFVTITPLKINFENKLYHK
jgi:hypothetical protein